MKCKDNPIARSPKNPTQKYVPISKKNPGTPRKATIAGTEYWDAGYGIRKLRILKPSRKP